MHFNLYIIIVVVIIIFLYLKNKFQITKIDANQINIQNEQPQENQPVEEKEPVKNNPPRVKKQGNINNNLSDVKYYNFPNIGPGDYYFSFNVPKKENSNYVVVNNNSNNYYWYYAIVVVIILVVAMFIYKKSIIYYMFTYINKYNIQNNKII